MKLFITDDAKQLMKNQYSLSIPNETGGILFGYYSEDLEAATITDVFYNIEDSKGRFRSFVRGKKGFKRFSTYMWSNGKYYLGEWHTHPHSLPNMSMQDKKQMVKIKENKEFKCPEPILAIVGENNNEIIIQTYIFFGDKIHCEKIAD